MRQTLQVKLFLFKEAPQELKCNLPIHYNLQPKTDHIGSTAKEGHSWGAYRVSSHRTEDKQWNEHGSTNKGQVVLKS